MTAKMQSSGFVSVAMTAFIVLVNSGIFIADAARRQKSQPNSRPSRKHVKCFWIRETQTSGIMDCPPGYYEIASAADDPNLPHPYNASFEDDNASSTEQLLCCNTLPRQEWFSAKLMSASPSSGANSTQHKPASRDPESNTVEGTQRPKNLGKEEMLRSQIRRVKEFLSGLRRGKRSAKQQKDGAKHSGSDRKSRQRVSGSPALYPSNLPAVAGANERTSSLSILDIIPLAAESIGGAFIDGWWARKTTTKAPPAYSYTDSYAEPTFVLTGAATDEKAEWQPPPSGPRQGVPGALAVHDAASEPEYPTTIREEQTFDPSQPQPPPPITAVAAPSSLSSRSTSAISCLPLMILIRLIPILREMLLL